MTAVRCQRLSGDYHSQRGFKFNPDFIPLIQLLKAILDFRLRIADLLYRCALSHFIKLTEYHKSEIQNLKSEIYNAT